VKAAAVLLAALSLTTPAVATAADACPDGSPVGRTVAGRPDHQLTGNRVVLACAGMGDRVKDFQLETVPAWVVAHPARPGNRWILADEDGTVSEFHQGRLTEVALVPPGEAPLVTEFRGELNVRPRSDAGEADDGVPGGRSVSTGFVGASLAGPTDRYAHGVLGDEIEASSLDIWTDYGSTPSVELAEHEVIEGISAIGAILGDGGPFGFLVTVSDAVEGARLRAYGEQGDLIAESDPIGQGFRWLHQIGVGATGPDGEIEIIAVRTPHIGGIVEAYQLKGDRFERVAAIEGYSSHVIGSVNLDMALLADTDADGQLEIVVPTQSMTELAILERTPDGFAEVATLPLDGRLASNIGAAVDRDGRLSLAVATEDGRLRIFR
jgi:hypothetical protein